MKKSDFLFKSDFFYLNQILKKKILYKQVIQCYMMM